MVWRCEDEDEVVDRDTDARTGDCSTGDRSKSSEDHGEDHGEGPRSNPSLPMIDVPDEGSSPLLSKSGVRDEDWKNPVLSRICLVRRSHEC